MQSDPIGLAGGKNTYSYVNHNPLMGIDPLGLKEVNEYNCKKLELLIKRERKNPGKDILYSYNYNPFSLTEDLIGLNANFESLIGPADIDWMARSNLLNTSNEYINMATYLTSKTGWNVMNSFITSAKRKEIYWQPFLNINDIGHINAPIANSYRKKEKITLEQMFEPAIKKCGCFIGE